MTATIQRVPRDLPAPTSAANMKQRLAMVLASQIGYREGRSASGDWNNDNAYGLYFKQNGVSWCNWFQSWGAVAAGIPATVIPRTGYTPSSWNWFTSRNRDVTTPQAGDLFWVYGYVSSEGQNRVHHIGFVEKVLSDGRIQTIEGNTNTSGSTQGNGVYRLTRLVTPKLKFARPDYAAAVQAATTPAKPTPAKPPTTGGTVTPPTPEDDMPYTPDQLKDYAGKGVHGQMLGRSTTTMGAAIQITMRNSAAALAQITGLTAAVQTLAEAKGVDAEALTAMVDTAVKDALADLKITLSVDDNDDTTPAQEG